ncbi:ArsR family transcriptional regulator [Romboutsia maritimum]|uniref:ArsR family transcriptional regulator n=1 Tax=Romboutsia maritimum TaxID=2020948 RepID=A0A371IRV1_9FIRM|nr:metalloregulator ArsR/SmtB family transcription factor [Romboutsia maritimum]RDY23194.1 ArsR family transcriptional regulator [Romboutsia maritimum]
MVTNEYESIFKALADEKRLKILAYLNQNGHTCVCKLVEKFDLSQSKLSYHLKLLLNANLINKTSEGKWNFYDADLNQLKNILSEETINKLFIK